MSEHEQFSTAAEAPTQQIQQQTAMSSKEAIAYLSEKFPCCFILEGEVKPLKIGLFQDVAEALSGDEKISKTVIRHALRSYTMSWRYLAVCVEGATRVDLNGDEAGSIDAEQAAHAAKTLADAKAAYAEKREQARKAQRKQPFKQKAREEQGKKRTTKRKPTTYKRSEPVQTTATENLTVLAESAIVKGAKVRVKVGSQAQQATILDIEKQSVRVQLASGLTITVAQNHLFA